MRVRRRLLGSDGRAGYGNQRGIWMVDLQPVGMVFDLGEVGINRLQFFSLSSHQGDADIQSKLLQDVNRSGIANEQVDGVVNRPSR